MGDPAVISKKVFNRKSKTHWASTAVLVLGSLMTFLPTVMQFIPTDWYGPIFIACGVTFHVLRNVTRTDIEAK